MKTNRTKKLAEARVKLKSDFVGLDKIIDKIIDTITPWYLTPEILERPTVISLWGLTGTGKTSLVRKLLGYLELTDKSMFFDCGEQGGESDLRLFSEKLDDIFEASGGVSSVDGRFTAKEIEKLGFSEDVTREISQTDPLDYTFVFDEFQYLNTKDPRSGEEDPKSESRAIWSLLDSGLVDINKSHWKIKSLAGYIEDLEFFSEEHPGLKISGGNFDKKTSDLLKQQLPYYRWGDEEDNDNSGFRVIFGDEQSFLVRRLNLLRKGLGFEVSEKMESFTLLSEFIEYIKDYIRIISKPRIINCSKSLVFVLGNLDEAFELTGDDLDPDIDADVYHEITSKVNFMDIKTALRKRFRDEQVGRFGNNIIIYPSLSKKDFVGVIEKELSRITGKFNTSKITITEKFRRLIYSEGVFPIQGVRPVFSTINSLLSPLLSEIILHGEPGEEYALDVLEDNFNVSQVTLRIIKTNGEILREKTTPLSLGALRSPERCKKLGLQAVHEASHAVLYYYLTGEIPSALVASNVFGDGGYMMDAVVSDFSVTSLKELKNTIKISLAGYFGERAFFEANLCSLGSSSDIKMVWEKLRIAFYEAGLRAPLRKSEAGV